jgi:hypothetical protein
MSHHGASNTGQIVTDQRSVCLKSAMPSAIRQALLHEWVKKGVLRTSGAGPRVPDKRPFGRCVATLHLDITRWPPPSAADGTGHSDAADP